MRRSPKFLIATRPIVLSAALLALTLPVAQLEAQAKAAASRTVTTATPPGAQAVYTAAQALRGDKLFSRSCLECHGRRDMNNADFQFKWNGRTVYDLYERIRSTMPENDPGGLSTGEYADIVAYLLKLNGMPEGKNALAAGPALRTQKLVLTVVR